MGAMRDELEERLLARAPKAVIYGRSAPRLPNTTCVGVTGLTAETLVIALDLAGVAVSAGSACSSGKVRASHVLTAMGVSSEEAAAAIRVSIGAATTPEDIAQFIDAFDAQLRRATHRALRAVG
jgi:cysteine desulfurase